MNGAKVLGAALLVLGILAMAYGGFSYTKNTDKVNIGPIHVQAEEKHDVNVPLWAGVAVTVAGVVLLVRKD
jgi:hypothetical protein